MPLKLTTITINRGDNIGYALLEDLSTKRLVENDVKDIDIQRDPESKTNTLTYKYQSYD